MAENPRRSTADPTLAKQGEGIGSPALASSGCGRGIHQRARCRGPQSALRTNAVACVGAQGASSRIRPQSISGQPVRNAARLCRLGVRLSAWRGPQQPPRRRAASSLPSGLSVAGTIPARPTRRRRCAGTAPASAPRPRRQPPGLSIGYRNVQVHRERVSETLGSAVRPRFLRILRRKTLQSSVSRNFHRGHLRVCPRAFLFSRGCTGTGWSANRACCCQCVLATLLV